MNKYFKGDLMNCGLIFYVSHKTSFCETELLNTLKNNDSDIAASFVAMSVDEFEKFANTCLNKANVLFIISDLKRKDDKSITKVLSLGLEKLSDKAKIYKLTEDETKGYMVKFDKKAIIILPDEPKEISNCAKIALEYL